MAEALVQHTGHEDWLWELVMGLSAVVTLLVGWFARIVWVKVTKIGERVEKTCNKMAQLELKLAEEYVSVVTFKEAIQSFKDDLHANINPLYDRLSKMDDFLRSERSRLP